MRSIRNRTTLLAAAILALSSTTAKAQSSLLDGGKLLLTQGISTIEGASGGGLASWATIAGYETRDGIGANAHATYVDVNDYTLRDFGAAVGFFNRVEFSYTREEFDTGSTGAKLGLGRNFTFDQDVYGAKLRLIGDLVYDQDTWLPQIAVGVQYKKNDQNAIIHAVGGKSDQGTDYYVAATKLFLDQSLVVDATIRYTKANQTGLLGFGGDRNSGYSPEFEGSLGYLLTKQLVVGGEYRTKPNNLGFAKESDWWDLFVAYAFNKHISATLAYADLGDIATFKSQHGVLVSLQAGF
jgi:hypothetical protein